MPKTLSKKSKLTKAKKARRIVPKKRAYNNSLRAQKSEQTQKLIVETLVALLVERRGQEVTFEEISKKSKVPERTIFRFFGDKQALHEATDKYVQNFLQASIVEIYKTNVVDFAKGSFSTFDKYENLVMAYVLSPFGQKARDIFRKKFNQLLISQILKEKKISLTREKEIRLAVMVTLVNAKIWYDLRTDFGYTGQEMGEAIAWALKTLIDKI